MLRWWIVLVLTVASATDGWAQPSSPASVTVKAQEVSTATEKKVVQLVTQRNVLSQRYDDELSTITRLKNQRKSWRTERQLKERLSEANETAKQLAAVTRDLAAAQIQLAGARRVLVTAIDAELAAQPAPVRRAELGKLRDQLVPQVKRAPQRIVIPKNIVVDLDADPEDLEEHAAELREYEAQLQRQIIGLEKQATDLDEIADLRKAHDRARVLDTRDADAPSRPVQGANKGGGDNLTETDPASPPPSPTGSGGGGLDDAREPAASFETEATVVLADVVDSTTIDGLVKAQRSGDPTQRASAVKKTRDAVKLKLDELRKKRLQMEQRAKDLRKK